jgi:hypothetical protein
MNVQTTQSVFASLRELGALVATPGISEEVKTLSNKNMETLLSILQKELQTLSAQSNGIIT